MKRNTSISETGHHGQITLDTGIYLLRRHNSYYVKLFLTRGKFITVPLDNRPTDEEIQRLLPTWRDLRASNRTSRVEGNTAWQKLSETRPYRPVITTQLAIWSGL